MRAGYGLRHPAGATQRSRLRDPRAADAGRRLRHHVHRHHRLQADRARPARRQADARAARRGAHAGTAGRARGAARREAARRAGQHHQDPVRRRGEPRPAAAAQRRTAVRLGARGTLDRSRRARDRRPHRQLDAGRRGGARRHARHRAPRERHAAHRDRRLRPGGDVRRPRAAVRAARGAPRPAATLHATGLPRAQRPGAAASRAAEPGVERTALHPRGRRAGRLPAPRRLSRAVRMGHRPRHPRIAAARDLRRVPPPRPALALGRAGPRAWACRSAIASRGCSACNSA